MTGRPKPPALDPAAVPAAPGSNYPEPFRARVAGRRKQRLGDALGLKNYGVNLTTLAPGAQSAHVLYATQTGTRPPTFVFFVNRRVAAHFSTRRFVLNQLRAEFDLAGVPLRIHFRARRRVDGTSAAR